MMRSFPEDSRAMRSFRRLRIIIFCIACTFISTPSHPFFVYGFVMIPYLVHIQLGRLLVLEGFFR
jgi:hypothetical protein